MMSDFIKLTNFVTKKAQIFRLSTIDAFSMTTKDTPKEDFPWDGTDYTVVEFNNGYDSIAVTEATDKVYEILLNNQLVL